MNKKLKILFYIFFLTICLGGAILTKQNYIIIGNILIYLSGFGIGFTLTIKI